MKSIAFVIPYFGLFNNYFQLWLNSCSKNPSIDWLIFTDDKRPFDYPDNVHVTYTTLHEVKKRIESTFGLSIWMEHAYKLCDFKPFYGAIFKPELKNYDFWGYCDVDLIWGNIRKYLTDDLLDKYYKIFQYGHCCLIQNVDSVTRLYDDSASGMLDYKTVLQSPLNYAFDENNEWGWNVAFDTLLKYEYLKDNWAYDVYVKKKKFYPADSMDKKKTEGLFEYDNGAVYGYEKIKNTLVKQEYLYVHLQKRDMAFPEQSVLGNHYLIVPNKFVKYPDRKLDVRLFDKLQPFPFLYMHEWQRKWRKLRNAFLDDSKIKNASRNKLEHYLDKLLGRKEYLWRK